MTKEEAKKIVDKYLNQSEEDRHRELFEAINGKKQPSYSDSEIAMHYSFLAMKIINEKKH